MDPTFACRAEDGISIYTFGTLGNFLLHLFCGTLSYCKIITLVFPVLTQPLFPLMLPSIKQDFLFFYTFSHQGNLRIAARKVALIWRVLQIMMNSSGLNFDTKWFTCSAIDVHSIFINLHHYPNDPFLYSQHQFHYLQRYSSQTLFKLSNF